MKILLTHSDPELAARESIDLWRIIRPFRELAKHVDWTIDHQSYLVDPNAIDKETSNIPTDKLVAEIERLGKYDLVWTSYFPDAVLFDCMMFMSNKFGTKFVLDVDDDMYHIPKSNTIWNDNNADANIKQMQYAIEHTPYLVTSSPILQNFYQTKRTNPTYLLPNYIGEDYQHKPFDNKDKVVITFFGGVAHTADFLETGCLKAIKRIMKKYKNVHVGTVGLELPELPPSRYTYYPGKAGQAWIDEVWPNINADIAVAPLADHPFNRRKTHIKWLEATLIPAAFIGSDIPPYKGNVINHETGLLVKNTSDEWYKGLEKLVKDTQLRQGLISNATNTVKKQWSIENKWATLKTIVETINKDETAQLPT